MEQQIVNVEQAEAWNGPEGAGWATDWERFDEGIRVYHERLLTASDISDGENVLDFGCGNGQTTREAARRSPSGSVLGLDLSVPMLSRARELTEADGLNNVEYIQGDAQVYPFDEAAFDIAISRFGSMFFADKVAAFTNIGRAIRPGGRLVLMVWQALPENEHFVAITGTLSAGRDLPKPPPGAPSPFGLADVDLGRTALEAAGFVDVQHEPVRGKFYAGADADDALAFVSRTVMAKTLLADLDDATSERALGELHAVAKAHETADGVVFDSASWLISTRRPE